MIKYLQSSVGFGALAMVIAAVAMLTGSDAHGQSNFFTPCVLGSLVDTSPNVASDINATFGIGVGPDCQRNTADDQPAQYNSGGLITFTPPEWGVAKGEDIPDGAVVGDFGSFARLGLLNNPCNNTLPVNFTLWDASIDRSNTITPAPPGTTNRLHNLALDGDNNGNSDGVDKWPSYLTDLGVDNEWDFTKLRARFMGVNAVSVSGLTVILNFLVFEPGTQLNENVDLDPALGYPALTVLQDPTAAAAPSDPVNDFCAPLFTTGVIKGQAGGVDFRKNAADGTYYFTTLTLAAADEDGDGIENGLDPCQFTADPDWDPRANASVGPGDNDGDGIPNSCDPFPDVKSICTSGVGLANTDEDCDRWMNRGDNCPLDANEDQEDADSDGLGDVCDPDDADRSGELIYECLIREVTIGNAAAYTGVDPNLVRPCNPGAAFPYTGQTAESGSPTVAPTDAAGNTFTPKPSTAGGGTGTGIGGPSDTGIGSLSPVGTEVPAWALALLALGTIGFFSSVALASARYARRK